MIKPVDSNDERERIAELNDYSILDTLSETAFDELTILASQICGTKISLISLIDSNRQWFKSKVGLDALETPRDISFCGHAILSNEILEVPDAGLDQRFKDNPLYLGDPYVRFYAGAPLITPKGYRIGTLCVIDDYPRSLTSVQRLMLVTLAKQVIIQLELRKKEQRLQEINQILDGVVNNIPFMLTVFNEREEFEWINSGWSRELGWSLEEMRSKNMFTELYPDAKTRSDYLNFIKSPSSKWMSFLTQRKNGQTFPVAWSSIHLPNGKLIGMGQDISEENKDIILKKAISDLRENFIEFNKDIESFCRAMLYSFSTIIDSHFVFVGEIGAEADDKVLLGRTGMIFLGEGCEINDVEKDKMTLKMKEVAQEGKTQIYENLVYIPIQHSSGLICILGAQFNSKIIPEKSLASLKPFFEVVSEVLYAYKLEEKIRTQANTSFHNSKLVAIGHLAAGVGHEINNPLTIISGILSLIEGELKESRPDLSNVFLNIDRIFLATTRIENIVKGLKNFARSEGLEKSDFNVTELINESFLMLKDIYQTENVVFEFVDLAQVPVYILGNRGRIQQILVNLFDNAKDATEGKEKRLIKVSVNMQGSQVNISVADNGAGIPIEMKDKIFEPFFTTKDVSKGTGIGLSIVSTAVKENDGTINFESNLGEGTIFTVTFPISEKKCFHKETLEPILNSNEGFSRKILIVDDEEDLRDILKYLFKKMGIIVDVAENGKEAYLKHKENSYDLILTDIVMPVMGGINLLKKIRGEEKLKKTRVIFISGGINIEDSEMLYINENSDGILAKPFNEKIIRQMVSDVTGK